jgi:hypothetical protein
MNEIQVKEVHPMNTQKKVLAHYTPRIRNKKWFTTVCDGNNNQGIHDQEQFKKAVSMLEYAAHNWRNPRLFHLVMKGATVPTYKQLLLRLCRKIRGAGASCDYKACIEIDSDKGLHCHVMFVLGNTATSKPERFITRANESGKVEVSLLRQVVREVQTDCADFKVSVQPPASQPVPYIEFNQTNNDLLNEAVGWCSYIFKVRSKPQGRCYLSSRPARRACVVKVDKSVSPPVCLVVSTVKETNFKNIRFPTSARGQKYSKTPVFKGISHFIAILPTILHHKTCLKQREIGVKSHFIGDLQPHSKGAGQPGRAVSHPAQHAVYGRGASIRLHPARSEVVSCDLPSKQSF